MLAKVDDAPSPLHHLRRAAKGAKLGAEPWEMEIAHLVTHVLKFLFQKGAFPKGIVDCRAPRVPPRGSQRQRIHQSFTGLGLTPRDTVKPCNRLALQVLAVPHLQPAHARSRALVGSILHPAPPFPTRVVDANHGHRDDDYEDLVDLTRVRSLERFPGGCGEGAGSYARCSAQWALLLEMDIFRKEERPLL